MPIIAIFSDVHSNTRDLERTLTYLETRTVQAYLQLGDLGVEPDMNTGGGTSDGRFIAPLGSEVAEFGLLNASIHQVNENTAVDDLESLVKVYSSVLGKLLYP